MKVTMKNQKKNVLGVYLWETEKYWENFEVMMKSV